MSPYTLALCGVTAGAFANEFFGLLHHTVHVPVYEGDVKLFIDAVAVICAGTIATMNSIANRSSLPAALLESSVPICLAYIAPSLFTTSIVHTFRNWKGAYRTIFSLLAGLMFIAFLSSLEHVLSDTHERVNNANVVFIIVSVLIGLIFLRKLVGVSHVHAQNGNPYHLFGAILGIIALFGGAMWYNHPDIISHESHRVLATVFGIVTLVVACYGIYVKGTEGTEIRKEI
jgi:hypothetical protein